MSPVQDDTLLNMLAATARQIAEHNAPLPGQQAAVALYRLGAVMSFREVATEAEIMAILDMIEALREDITS